MDSIPENQTRDYYNPLLQGDGGALKRALYKSMGFTDEALSRPLVAVVNSYTNATPGHAGLNQLQDLVVRGIEAACGTAMVFSTIAPCDGIAEGLTPDEARQRNSVRIFGAPPGGYGTGVNKAIESGAWKTVQDLADVYIDWCSNGYERGGYGQKMKGEFVRRFSKVSATVKNMPDREIDLLDCDDVYEYLGGMNAFVRAYGRKDAMTIMGDGSNPKNTKVRSTKEELRYTFRSKVLNPKFINGLKEHGYRGAAELANITEYTMAWGATSDVAEDWMYEGMTDKFLLDKDTREWMMDVNPYAAMNILNRLEEAIERGLWNATDEYKEKLKDLFIETEERIEELTDR